MSRTDHADLAASFAEKAEKSAAQSEGYEALAITNAILAVYHQLAEMTDQARSGAIDLGNELNDIKTTVETICDVATSLEGGETDRA